LRVALYIFRYASWGETAEFQITHALFDHHKSNDRKDNACAFKVFIDFGPGQIDFTPNKRTDVAQGVGQAVMKCGEKYSILKPPLLVME
jgi:hypothetical protein